MDGDVELLLRVEQTRDVVNVSMRLKNLCYNKPFGFRGTNPTINWVGEIDVLAVVRCGQGLTLAQVSDLPLSSPQSIRAACFVFLQPSKYWFIAKGVTGSCRSTADGLERTWAGMMFGGGAEKAREMSSLKPMDGSVSRKLYMYRGRYDKIGQTVVRDSILSRAFVFFSRICSSTFT